MFSILWIPVFTAGDANSNTLILMLLAPLSNKPFICKLKYFLDKSTSSTVSSSFTVSHIEIHPSEMGHLVHNAFYELVIFQGHKLFLDNIHWSYSVRRIVGVFYLDFNRHDTQTDKTRRLFSHRMISSPPSNVWQFVSQRNQSTVIMNATTDVIKRSTWIRSKSLLNRFFLFFFVFVFGNSRSIWLN